MFDGLFFGTISAIFPPGDKRNSNKSQYEYEVILTGELYSQMYVRCIKLDLFGGAQFHADDVILDEGYRVFLMFPRGDSQMGVILGGSRQVETPQKEEGEGPRRLIRFNELEQEINTDGDYSIKVKKTEEDEPDAEFTISNKTIILDTHPEEEACSVVMDRETQHITIKTKDITLELTGKKSITVKGDVDITTEGSVNITAKKDCKVQAKSVEIEADTAKVTAKQKASIEAQTIELAGAEGQVLTTATQPACYVTGAPFVGSTKVKAGS